MTRPLAHHSHTKKPTQCGAGNSQQSRAKTQRASLKAFTRSTSSRRLICHKLKASLKEIWVLLKNERVFCFWCLQEEGREERGERETVRQETRDHRQKGKMGAVPSHQLPAPVQTLAYPVTPLPNQEPEELN